MGTSDPSSPVVTAAQVAACGSACVCGACGAKPAPESEAQTELRGLGPFEGKTPDEIDQLMASKGFGKVGAFSGGAVYTKQMGDGSTAAVRTDPAKVRIPPKNFADEKAHAHKEVVPTAMVANGNYAPKAKTSLDDKGDVTTDPSKAHIPIKV